MLTLRIWLRFSWLLVAIYVHAASLSLRQSRFTISSSDANQLRADALLTTTKPDPLILGPSDTLKLTFEIVESNEGKGVQPHQTFLRFYDSNSGEEGIQPVRVTPGGKARFELNMARPSASLPPTTDRPLEVSLVLGSFVHEPITFDLFDLYIPPSQTPVPHPDEVKFRELPLIYHTFRPEQKHPPKFVSGMSAVLVLAPWAILLGLWGKLDVRVPHLFSAYILPFTILLVVFEALLWWYWVDLKLGSFLLYGVILTIPMVFAGKLALARAGGWRTGNH